MSDTFNSMDHVISDREHGDGLLSTYSEIHALIIGVTVGLLYWSDSKHVKDFRDEGAYAAAGFFIGYIFQNRF